MALPRKLKGFQLFVDGVGYLGECEELVLPKLTRKMEEYRGGGMDGTVDIDLGQEKLEVEITMGAPIRDMLKTYGVCNVTGVSIRAMGSLESDDDCTIEPVEVVLRGRFNEIDMGTWKGGDSSTTKFAGALAYYKYKSFAEDIIEIDVLNHILKIDGEDKYALRRAAMGMMF